MAAVEAPGRATRYSETVRRPDGRWEVAASPAPVNYRDEQGRWRPIRTELVASDEAGAAAENAANSYEIKIPQNASSGPVQFSDDGAWVKVRMRGLGGPPQVRGNTAVFEDVVGAESVTLTDSGSGLKEDINLATAPVSDLEQLEYVYDLTVSDGVAPVLTPGMCAVAAPVLIGAGLAGGYGTYRFFEAAYLE